MDVRDAFQLTGASIRTHKLRSVLAAIGVVLGIGSVIGVVTMGAGFQEVILGTFTSEFDADLLGVNVERQQATGGPPSGVNVDAFTDRDLDALAALPHASAVGASRNLENTEVKAGDKPLYGVVVSAARGTTFSHFEQGRGFRGAAEAIASNATALRLMAALGTTDIVGTTLDVTYPKDGGFATATVTLVGIEKPSSFLNAETLTVDASYAPLVPVDGQPTHVWRSVGIRATSAGDVGALKDEAKAYLEGGSDAKARKGDTLVFRYDTQESVTALISTAIGQFTAFIGGLGAVALLVGLVGIANIMLVSVSERTREIGVMKATGASRGDVMLIFLVESIAICVVGALLGIGLGMLMGMGLNALVGALSQPSMDVPFVPVYDWYAIAVFLGVLVGLVAGLYPAWRAAKVSPVEALRYE